MASLNDFIDPDLTTNDVLHSNGYGAAAGGGGAGGLSMERRRELLNTPRTVGSYQFSELGRRQSAIKARTADQTKGRAYDASSDTFSDRAHYVNRSRDGGSIDRSNTPPAPEQHHFTEPSARPKPGGHDPFA